MPFRRAVAAVLVGLVALTACSGSGGRQALAQDLAAAAEKVQGVSAAVLSYQKGSAGTNVIVGDVTLSTADPAESAQTLENLYTAMVPVLRDGGSVSLRFETKDATGAVVPTSAVGFNGYPTSSQVIEKFGG